VVREASAKKTLNSVGIGRNKVKVNLL